MLVTANSIDGSNRSLAIVPGLRFPGLGRVALVLTLVIALIAPLVAAPVAAQQDRPDSFADLAERLLPSVVNIQTTQRVASARGPQVPNFPPGAPFEDLFRDFFERRRGGDGEQPRGPARRATSLGSGFIIDASGIVVTNNHVIDGADEINVVLQDDTNYPAELIGIDQRTDIAVLRIQPDQPLPAVPWGDIDEMRVGDWVMAIGNPFGLGGTVTTGIISAFSRDINQGPYDDFIQTDASINRGNSGGPMFNLDGEVIGINTAIFSPTGGSVGIGFAIPASLAEDVVGQITEFGRTRRGWLGVQIQTVTDEIADSLGLEDSRGALVARVTPGGPAEEGGIEAGDVILEFDGTPVDQMSELPRLVANTTVGSRVPVQVWRRGDLETVRVALGELEVAEEQGLLAATTGDAPDAGSATREALGLGLSGLTEALRDEYDLGGEIEGVVITEVEDGSEAQQKGLAEGTIILEVGQEPVRSPGDVVAMIEQARERGRQTVLLLIQREGEISFVPLRIERG